MNERKRLRRGFVQVYTGNGKGKTTAALGLAMRAVGAGLRVYFVQFMKDFPYSELNILRTWHPQLVLQRFGNDDFVLRKEPPSDALKAEMRQALDAVRRTMQSGEFDLIVLDEILVSIHFQLFRTQQVHEFIQARPPQVELILTGRYCPQEIIQAADLVTEMKEIKHYYQQGVLARKGIES